MSILKNIIKKIYDKECNLCGLKYISTAKNTRHCSKCKKSRKKLYNNRYYTKVKVRKVKKKEIFEDLLKRIKLLEEKQNF